MKNIIQTNIVDYVDADGKIKLEQPVRTVQIRSENDLALLTGYGPGTRAYLADQSAMWV